MKEAGDMDSDDDNNFEEFYDPDEMGLGHNDPFD